MGEGLDRTLRNINNNDQFVSAREIFEQNDSFFDLKNPSVPDQNWSDNSQSQASRVRGNPALLNFTAQTPLAASYGIMQMLYTTAIRPLGWTGIKSSGVCYVSPEDCNPSFLFDTDENIALGGGTITLASALLRRGFIKQNSTVSISDPEFNNSTLLNIAFQNMLRSYNKRGTYPQEVMNFVGLFLPVPATGIFP